MFDLHTTIQERISTFMQRVYGWMALGLAVTAGVAYQVSTNTTFVEVLYQNSFVFWGLLLTQIGLAIWLSTRYYAMSYSTTVAVFMLYTALSGITLSLIFLVYTLSSIATIFFITSGMFGGMALYGYFTKTDLTRLGSFLMMALLGLILCSVVNIFMQSGTLYLAQSVIGVLVFTLFTAYDVQKIKQLAMTVTLDHDEEMTQKFGVLGALVLYLDFVNLFLYLLRIFGKRRR